MARSPTDKLIDAFARLPVTQNLGNLLGHGAKCKAGGLWGASAALLLAALRPRHDGTMLLLTADDVDSLLLQTDLAAFGVEALVLPREEHDDDGQPDASTRSERQRVMQRFGDGKTPLCASLEALLQPVATPKSLRRSQLELQQGQQLDRAQVLQRAQAAGLRSVPLVLAPGECSVRGDVVDLFPMAAEQALRLEFFDRTLESIRSFDPATQRTTFVHEHFVLALANEETAEAGPVVKHLTPSRTLVVAYEPLRLEERTARLLTFDSGLRAPLALLQDTLHPCARLDVSSLPSHDHDFKVLSAGSAAGSGEADPTGRLRSVRGVQGQVLLFCRSEDERERLREIFAHKQVDLQQERVELLPGAISRGFRMPDLQTTALSNIEFAGVPQQARVRERAVVPSRAIQSFFELGPGDLVVHAVHGVARFEGTELVHRGEGTEEHLRLCFQDEVKLLVPASKIHLVQKYVGSGSHRGAAMLDKLGGKGFQKRKEQVQEALFDLAAELLEVQSKRALVQRPPYHTDPLERDFLDTFPFRDTPDQTRAWSEIQRDLEQPSPMDRLLCGDVGFGKTEVALRTAFRVAISGRQVAVLAPTTILAEQHARTFRGRCEPFGLSVEMLSRYRKPGERREIHDRLAKGTLDIVVGTHQLLSNDVTFHDLGLVVIDEEQRFGVRQKERLKQLRAEVDVLTLSATPIPRTLHGSLLGIRGISTLDGPPPGRQEVETRVLFRDDRVLQDALQRELARQGQVFVLHNRIAELPVLAQRLRQLAPGARIAIGHGQMTESEIEKTVRAFVRGDFDVLVSTTIVENGLDIARANTILIDHADQFGLAELHQLRGRVGRSSEKAFCYLLLDRDEPPGLEARQRLKALEEFSHLGAGFAIAMKDLEIRGAGNLLGPEQSGHIAAVGYDMYCQLLRAAVDSAKVRRPTAVGVVEVDVDLRLQAYLPEHFLKDPRQRLELLREMDEAVDDERLAALEAELRDRYGKLPKPVQTLLRVFRLKHGLMGLGVHAVQWVEQDRVVVRHQPGVPLGGSWIDCFGDVRPVEAGKTHLMLPKRRTPYAAENVLDFMLLAITGRLPPTAQQRPQATRAAAPPSRPKRPTIEGKKPLPWE
ncbi:MAG: transcription-repair coupling factor [Planctomycetes bacterium]|nr:transcription-repair coupling factor [Planctomycetota bacterium]